MELEIIVYLRDFFVKLNEQRPSLLEVCYSEKKCNFSEKHVHVRFIQLSIAYHNEYNAKLIITKYIDAVRIKG